MTTKSKDLLTGSIDYPTKISGERSIATVLLGSLWCALGTISIFVGSAALRMIVNSLLSNHIFEDLPPVLVLGSGLSLGIGATSILVGYGLLRARKGVLRPAVAISLLFVTSSVVVRVVGFLTDSLTNLLIKLTVLLNVSLGILFSPSHLPIINILGYLLATTGILTLLMHKRLREYLKIYYEHNRSEISTREVVTIVSVAVVLTTVGYGYAIGMFSMDAIDATQRLESDVSSAGSNSLGVSGWSTATDMPTARDEPRAASIDNKIYVVGGLDATLRSIGTVEIYDPRSNTWSSGKELPIKLDHVAVASYQNKLYVMGGFVGDWMPSNTLFIFDPLTNEWTRGADMPTPRGALTAEFVNGILYAVGGLNGVSLTTNETYDPVTNRWTVKVPMPTARDHLASGVVDGKLYVIGGRPGDPFMNLNVNEEYDPAKDEWDTKAPMPTHRGGLTASSLGDSIYVFCGESPTKVFFETEQYIPSLDKWIVREKISTARHGCDSAEVLGSIYVIGGSTLPGFSGTIVSAKNEVFTPMD